MKTIRLHIGLPKTGTSALQAFFAQNINALKTKGILYPELQPLDTARENRITSGNANNIAFSMFQSFEPGEDELKKLYHLLEEHNEYDFLLSSENLCFAHHDQLLSFNEEIKNLGYTTKIIIYLRRQDHWFSSVYSQRVKRHHLTISPEEFIQNELKKNDSINNFYLRIKHFEKIFNKENIIIRCYEKSQFYKRNIFSDFLFALNIKDSAEFVFPKKLINPNGGRILLEFLRLVNRFEPPHTFSDQLLELFPYENNQSNNINVFSPKIRIGILSFYDELNQKIAKEYLGRKDGTLFYEPWPDINENWEPYPGLNVDELANISGKMFINEHNKLESLSNQVSEIKRQISELRSPFFFLKRVYRKLRSYINF